MPEPKLRLTTAEAAEKMGISTAQVIKHIQAGDIAARKEGNRWAVSTRSVVAWLRKQRMGS